MMDSEKNDITPNSEVHDAFELSLQRYSIFSLQNVEDGFFDVTFLFKEKQLHAHSFILWSASETFKAMLLGPMATKDPIAITTYSYEDFKEFLTYLYLGKCTITMENVMALVDLAEAYNVELLKDKCDQFLTNTEISEANLYTVYEKLKMYNLTAALENLFGYVSFNTEAVLANFMFMSASNDFVCDLVKHEALSIQEEKLFNGVLKWAQWQYNKQQKEGDVKEWIKNELVDMISYIRFPVMSVEFLHEVIVPNGYLFSSLEELSKILRDADAFGRETKTQENSKILIPKLSKYNNKIRKSKNKIIFTDNNGNKAFAFIPDKAIMEALKKPINQNNTYFHGNMRTNNNLEYFWQNDIPKPTKKLWQDLSKYYVVRNAQGKFGLKEFSNQFILAQNTAAAAQSNMQPNIQNNSNNNVEIIAKLYLEKENFVIAQGCHFKIDQ